MYCIKIKLLIFFFLILLFLNGCQANRSETEEVNGIIESQEEDINQTNSNLQSIFEDSLEPIKIDPQDSNTIYPQTWSTGNGTSSNPWSNDCIQKAYDSCPSGGTIFLKAGFYQLSGMISLNKQINLIGEGMGKTIIITANDRGFQVNANYCVIKNLTVDGAAQTDGNSGMVCINASQANHLLFENVEVKNAGYYGINFNDPNYCTLKNIHGHDNYRHGLHSGTTPIANSNQHNIYSNIDCWNNGVCGFDDRGGTNSIDNQYDNLKCFDNGLHGIAIAYQKNGVLSDSSASGNGLHGIWLSSVEDFQVINCSTSLNGGEGVYVVKSINVITMN